MGKSVHPGRAQFVGNRLVVHIPGHLVDDFGSHIFLSQFLLYQSLTLGPEGEAVVLPELGEGSIIAQVLLPESDQCLLYHLIAKAASMKPVLDLRFAARAVTEITVGCIEGIL